MTAPQEHPPFEVTFLDKLQRLLAEGLFTATYKFAVLIGLVELSVEALPGTDTFTTRQLAEKVANLYWPQVLPFDDIKLRQSGQQARIVAAVDDFRTEVTRGGNAGGLLSSARARSPGRWNRMVLEVEKSLIFMPLPRLQELPSGTDEFLYRIGWTLEEARESSHGLQKNVSAYQRGLPGCFDNRIVMQDKVVPTLARFQGLVRELVEARWVRKVRDLNGDRLEDRDLQRHLFGFDREQLSLVAEPLLELNEGRCFYCGGRAVKAHVDHFIPWARYPDNRLVNLVPAHDSCNGAKSAYLASAEHVDHWLQRFTQPAVHRHLETIANQIRWPLGNDETLAVSRVLYAQQPEGARLWYARGVFRQFERADIGVRIDAAIQARRAA